jgi:hypothetical protein
LISEMVGWTPVRISWTSPGAEVEWRDLGTRPFLEPFFEDTVRAALAETGSRRRRTGLRALEEVQQASPGVPPSGFIFHLSRCGSTLVSQALAALPGTVVLSEAAPVDSIIRAPGVAAQQRARWLVDVLGALGQRRGAGAQRLFVKLDCWNTIDLPLIKAAFPRVPWIFVYRDPLEVMVSHERQRGQHMVPGIIPAEVFGIDPSTPMGLHEYGARVLGAICRAALSEQRPGDGLLVSYAELPAALGDIVRFFGMTLTDADRQALAAVSGRHAKRPDVAFVDDTEAKREAITPALREAVDAYAAEAYRLLEERRRCSAA